MTGIERVVMEHFEEERRLLHVAVTRAKEHVYVTYVRQNIIGTEECVTAEPSTFLRRVKETMAFRRFPADGLERQLRNRNGRESFY